MEKNRIHIFVSGRVQGVFFRDFTRQTALGLGLIGWVRNLADGRVEIIAQGEKEILNQFIELVKAGPPASKVKDCQIDWGEFKAEFKGFEIRY